MQNGLSDGEVDIFGFQTFGEAQIAVRIRTGKKAEIWFTKPCEFGVRIRQDAAIGRKCAHWRENFIRQGNGDRGKQLAVVGDAQMI